ncbi:MAG: hypothetical protein LBF25_01985 [Puniceicoccales bacterium]|jgi:hypothetical protein|nr:hypothetical protein [Puniceicoccales bacterium]
MSRIKEQNYGETLSTTRGARRTNREFRVVNARETNFHEVIEPRRAGVPLSTRVSSSRQLSDLSPLEMVVLYGTLASAFTSPLPPDLHERAINPSLKVLQREVDALATAPKSHSLSVPPPPAPKPKPPVPTHQVEEWGVAMASPKADEELAPVNESHALSPSISLEANATRPEDTTANLTAMATSIPEPQKKMGDASEDVRSGASPLKAKKGGNPRHTAATRRTETQHQSQNTTASIVAGIEEIAAVANLVAEKTRLEEENRNLTVTGGSQEQIRENERQIQNLGQQIISAGGHNRSALGGMEPAMMNLSTTLATAIENGKLSRDDMNAAIAYINATYRQNSTSMGRLEYIYHRFSQFQGNETVFNEFIRIANSYGNLADRVKFIYNALIFPYQKDREGSCFATSILDAMWVNNPSGYMRLIDKLIREDRADFNVFFSGPSRPELIIDTQGIGIRAGSDAIYQKAVSALASLVMDKSIYWVKESIYDVCFHKINETNVANKMGMTDASIDAISNAIATNLTDKIVWDRQWTPDINVTRSLNETAIVEAMGSYIMDILSRIPRAARMGEPDARAIANAIRQADGEGGGDFDLLMKKLLGLNWLQLLWPSAYRVVIDKKANPAWNTIFNTADMQPLLRALEFRSSWWRPRHLKPGQAIGAGYMSDDGGHAFTLISGHYDVNAMRVGEEVRIGHMNYIGEPEGENFIYLKKRSPTQVQFTYGPDREPLKFSVEELSLYPDVLTEYEPIP